MSSCLSRGGRTYGLELEIIKSASSTSSRSCQSSTLSEASNASSPLANAIYTRKPRTPRKRPNQTYNEAAALLSTAYPYLFSTKNFTKPRKFTKPHLYSFSHDSSGLLFPFRVIHDSGFLLRNQPKPIESEVENLFNKSWACRTSSEMEFNTEFLDDFDAESILDEETEEGIDSIMGNLSDTWDESNGRCEFTQLGSWYTNPIGALRRVDQGNWCNFSTVDMLQISPKTITTRGEKKNKKPIVVMEGNSWENPNPKPNTSGLKLKLNYEEVVNAWSEGGSPFSVEPPGIDDYAQMDLSWEAEGGVREASVLRYKQKRRTRLFSTKIRHQVRKVNAD